MAAKIISKAKGPDIGLDIRVIPIEDIESNDYNPNAMSNEQFDVLVDHLKTEGRMVQPLLVRPNPHKDGPPFMAVDGEHRWKAAKMAGFKEIVAVVVPYDDDHAKFRTVSMNKLRGEYIPLKMAKLLADLQDRYSDDDIRRMTGIPKEEFISLSNLLDVPDIDFNDSPMVGMEQIDRPIEVNILLMPDENSSYEEAMVKAMELGAHRVVPLIGEEVGQYDKAMKASFDLASTKLRNVGLATICRVFNELSDEHKQTIIEKLDASTED